MEKNTIAADDGHRRPGASEAIELRSENISCGDGGAQSENSPIWWRVGALHSVARPFREPGRTLPDRGLNTRQSPSLSSIPLMDLDYRLC
jgi:hypothetical protein